MVNKHHNAKFLSFFFILLISVQTAFGQDTIKKKVYVWEFATPRRKTDSLTERFTKEFEETLQEYGSGCFTILVRREMDKFVNHYNNEMVITSTGEISQKSRESLKAKKADMVVFGEIDDDIEDGKLKIKVDFQYFDSEVHDIKSIHLDRGLRFDSRSREKAMKELVQKICLPPSGPPPSAKTITIESFPVKAELSVNDSTVGMTPYAGRMVLPGSCKITLIRKNYSVVSDSLYFDMAGTISKRYWLKKSGTPRSIQWIRRISFGSITVAGLASGLYFNKKAKTRLNTYNNSRSSDVLVHEKNWDKFEDARKYRNVLYGLAGVGAAGVMFSIFY